jgi:hypothetical protein
MNLWLSASGSAEFLDVSPDTIARRGTQWPKDGNPVPGKVRWKKLKLGEGTRMEKRFFRPDLEALLVE